MLSDQAQGALEDETEESYEGSYTRAVPRGESLHLLGRLTAAVSEIDMEVGEERHQERFQAEVEREGRRCDRRSVTGTRRQDKGAQQRHRVIWAWQGQLLPCGSASCH